MKVNFIGNYAAGYVGEQADEVHLTRELERLGNEVNRIPRDIWKAHCDGESDPNWKQIENMKADINVICKWHHFNDEKYITQLKKESHAPVFYWVWDYMYDQGFPDWHIKMAREADLYLSNEGGLFEFYQVEGVKPYYFPMDVCDGDLPVFDKEEKIYDVVFPGSYLGQGDRIHYLKEINKEIPVTIFAWNWEEWQKNGFTAFPAVYGAEFNKMIAQSKIVLGFNVNAHCWGYWSNRVGKVITAGGLLIQQYAPGMESLPVVCFSSPQEAIDHIKRLLPLKEMWKTLINFKFTSRHRMLELYEIMLRYLKEGKLWNSLP